MPLLPRLLLLGDERLLRHAPRRARRFESAAQLAEGGADPDRRSAFGLTPLASLVVAGAPPGYCAAPAPVWRNCMKESAAETPPADAVPPAPPPRPSSATRLAARTTGKAVAHTGHASAATGDCH